jgi:xanthine dehydrogenase YagR molybdenum-binding subunit
MACDALQCGFCTPGFINEGIAFVKQWRQEHGLKQPSRNEVAQALAGHLCRCGAYPGIYEAIQGACTGQFDEGEIVSPRVEALEKVTGRAKYTVDIRYEGQLEGRILRSLHPHAKIVSIDTSAALALPGVKAVVELLNQKRIVRYVGQEILAVAAVDHRTATEALEKIKIEYEVLPAVIGPEAARLDNAPPVYTGFMKEAPSSAEGILIPGQWAGNVRTPVVNIGSSRGGQAKKRIREAREQEAANLVEGTWQTAVQSHTTLEPHACVAYWKSDQTVLVHLSTQACDLMAREIARHFKVSRQQVQVLCPHIGGGFGAKLTLTGEAIAAVSLSRETNAPVRVVLDRPEELTVGGHRPAAKIDLSLLATSEGQMSALSVEAQGDAGIAIGSLIAAQMGFIYPGAPKNLVDRDVVSHTPPGTPFRGPGGPLACWSLEQAVDEMAHKIGDDPLALRRRWDPDPLRQKLYDWAQTIPTWRDRPPVAAEKGRFRRGIGLAVGHWFYFFHSATQVEVTASAEGITVKTAAQDMGNGTRTVLAQAVAEVFGIAPTTVNVHIGDSHNVRGPLSGGSRTTNSVYPTAQEAATKVCDQLVMAAGQHLDLENAMVGSGGIDHAGGHLAWTDILEVVPAITVVAGRGKDKVPFTMPLAFGADGLTTGRGSTGVIHISEVEIDTRLGKIRPLRVWGGLAVGKIVAPVLARSQCYGGVIQGLGYALYEERQLDMATGRVLSLGLEDYRIPAIGDIPEIEIHFIEAGFEHARGGGVGLGELSTLPVAASIGNAVFNATGWRPYHLPIRPEHVMKGVRE